jgi:zinc transporter ZupT
VLAVTLSFAAAVLIYLPTEELLGEAHALRDTSVGTLALFAGFAIFLAIDLAARGWTGIGLGTWSQSLACRRITA